MTRRSAAIAKKACQIADITKDCCKSQYPFYAPKHLFRASKKVQYLVWSSIKLFVCLHARSVWRHTWVLMDQNRTKCSSQTLKPYISMLALWSMEIIVHTLLLEVLTNKSNFGRIKHTCNDSFVTSLVTFSN